MSDYTIHQQQHHNFINQCWVNYFPKVIQLLITNYSSQCNLITNYICCV